MSKYNGWTNYATWRVNLECFSDGDLSDFGGEAAALSPSDLAEELKSYVEYHVEETSEGLGQSYAFAFLMDVNWIEIAQHLIDDYKEETAA